MNNEATLFGDPLVATDLSFGRGDIGPDGAAGCEVLLEAKAIGEVVRAGLPAEDPMLDTLACLFVPGAGGGSGPSPSTDAGLVAAATAEAYFNSIGGLVGCAGGLGIPLGKGRGGAVAAVEVTTGRMVATLARRIAGTSSLGFVLLSSF